jgi:hypothetical protein
MQVWRGATIAAATTGNFSLSLYFLLGYGLEFMPGALALERGMIPWLAIISRV